MRAADPAGGAPSSGLVSGIAVAPALAARVLDRVNRARQGRWLLAALAPTAVDWVLGTLGVWANTPASRVSTGVLFGLAAGVILGSNLLRTRPSHPHPLAHAV